MARPHEDPPGPSMELASPDSLTAGDRLFITGSNVEESSYLGETYAEVRKVERKKIETGTGPREQIVVTATVQLYFEPDSGLVADQVWVVQ